MALYAGPRHWLCTPGPLALYAGPTVALALYAGPTTQQSDTFGPGPIEQPRAASESHRAPVPSRSHPGLGLPGCPKPLRGKLHPGFFLLGQRINLD